MPIFGSVKRYTPLSIFIKILCNFHMNYLMLFNIIIQQFSLKIVLKVLITESDLVFLCLDRFDFLFDGEQLINFLFVGGLKGFELFGKYLDPLFAVALRIG